MDVIEKFEKLGRMASERNPGWSHKRLQTPTGVRFEYPKLNDRGFDVAIVVGDDEIYLETDTGWHAHYHEASDEEREGLTGLVRDMLSPAMRIRELRAGDGGYRWHLEVLDKSKWLVESTIGLLLWNFLASRSEVLYQNEHLPAREDVLN